MNKIMTKFFSGIIPLLQIAHRLILSAENYENRLTRVEDIKENKVNNTVSVKPRSRLRTVTVRG